MSPFIQAVISANEEIYHLIKNGIDNSLALESNIGAGGDISTALDLKAEEIFVKHLSSFGKIESEESGIIGEGTSHIILDPIDGSSNALSNFPYYGTSVALIDSEGLLECAIVCNLANRDIFIKESNKPTKKGKLFESEFYLDKITNFSKIGLFEKAYANATLIKLLDENNLKFRAPGAIALSLAYARSVEFVLFVGEFRIYDFAAGLALCEGLEVIVEQDYVIVSKSKTIANKIEELILKIKKQEQ
jgi:myo-inositol-1(or 4)-monophosphatase